LGESGDAIHCARSGAGEASVFAPWIRHFDEIFVCGGRELFRRKIFGAKFLQPIFSESALEAV
jgi:hypothetical protein